MRESNHPRRKEERLVDRAAGQTLETFPELVRSNSKLIYRVSLGILKNHADAEDNLQNVLVKVYHNIHRFEGRSRLSSWLVRIAINEALMKTRKRELTGTVRHMTASPPDEDFETLKMADDRPNPEHHCIANDLAAKALGCLSPYLRDTFVLCKADGWTQQELADAMGVSTGTIKSRIFRARRLMKDHLDSLSENSATTLFLKAP
jgi:RNA polymerase sigma-70 factor (ECF subfamily)